MDVVQDRPNTAQPPRYRAEQAADGTWTIRDVPVFGEHTDRRSVPPRSFGADFLRLALQRAQVRASEGYLPPLHLNHHGDADPVAFAGHVQLKRVGLLRHGGCVIQALFADLVGIPDAVYRRIAAGELPYRSIEIIDLATGEIDSLALLDHEVPYFRFPLLRVAEGALMSAGSAGSRYAAIYRWEQTMTPEETKPADAPAVKAEEMPKPAMTYMENGLAEIKAWLMAIAEKLGVEPPNPESAPAPQADGIPAEMPAPAMSAQARGEQTAMMARFKALESRLAASESATKLGELRDQLRARGYGADVLAEVGQVWAAEGEAGARAYVRGVERFGPAEPPRTWTGELNHGQPDAPEVSAYAAKGPEALEAARSMAASWSRGERRVKLGDYLAANLDPEEFLARR
jgi:hypothetical protein